MNVHIQVLCFPFNCRERRGCLVGTHLIFWEMAKLFSKEAVPFCNPASRVPGIHSLHILPQTCWGLGPQLLAFLEHVLTSPCISLTICEVECYFLCYLYKISCIFFGKITVQFLPIFHCIISYRFSWNSALCIPDTGQILSDTYFTKISSQSVTCLLIFINVLWKAEGFFKIILLIYLFLAVLGPCCCAGFPLVVEIGGYSLLVVWGFSLPWFLWLQNTGPRNCSSLAQ